MAPENTFSDCCLRSFTWDGTPTGHETTLYKNPTYVTGTNSNAAVLYVHDALGWDFTNARLLADHYAREANVTVFIPDFFGGELLDKSLVLQGKFHELDMVGFTSRNNRGIREPEIFACAKALRDQGYKKIGAIGFCFGGWGVLRLASNPPLVDAIVCAHPSWTTKSDFDTISVPVQILSPEIDPMFSPELKSYAFQKLVLEKTTGKDGKGVPVEWLHFPGLAHGCLSRGDETVDGERDALIRAKDAAVNWFRQWLTT